MPDDTPHLNQPDYTATRALDLQGTCTGEHGEAVEPMRAIKRALDPHNLFNPGKLFAEGSGVDAV